MSNAKLSLINNDPMSNPVNLAGNNSWAGYNFNNNNLLLRKASKDKTPSYTQPNINNSYSSSVPQPNFESSYLNNEFKNESVEKRDYKAENPINNPTENSAFANSLVSTGIQGAKAIKTSMDAAKVASTTTNLGKIGGSVAGAANTGGKLAGLGAKLSGTAGAVTSLGLSVGGAGMSFAGDKLMSKTLQNENAEGYGRAKALKWSGSGLSAGSTIGNMIVPGLGGVVGGLIGAAAGAIGGGVVGGLQRKKIAQERKDFKNTAEAEAASNKRFNKIKQIQQGDLMKQNILNSTNLQYNSMLTQPNPMFRKGGLLINYSVGTEKSTANTVKHKNSLKDTSIIKFQMGGNVENNYLDVNSLEPEQQQELVKTVAQLYQEGNNQESISKKLNVDPKFIESLIKSMSGEQQSSPIFKKGGLLKSKSKKSMPAMRNGGRMNYSAPMYQQGGKLSAEENKFIDGLSKLTEQGLNFELNKLSKAVKGEKRGTGNEIIFRKLDHIKTELNNRKSKTTPIFKKGGKTESCKKGGKCGCTKCKTTGLTMIFRRGGKVDLSKQNVIVDGPSHDEFNNTGVKGDKGLPIVKLENGGKAVKIAEIESRELLINPESSKAIQALRNRIKDGDSTAKKELADLLNTELKDNTYDYSNLLS
jgi:hypothetical protein